MNEVSRVLFAIEQGDPHAAAKLLPLVYEETPGQTLQATALVHEAYLRFVGDGQKQPWNSRDHFFAAARRRCAEFWSRRLGASNA